MRFRIPLLLLLFLSIAGFAAAQAPYHVPSSILHPKGPTENVHVQWLFGDDHATGFMIWVQDSVPLHKHAAHSETVYVIAGRAEMILGHQIKSVRAGDIIFIPQGTPHAVTVRKGTLKVLSVQAPMFDGTDRILLR